MRRGVQGEREQGPRQERSPARALQGGGDESPAPEEAVQVPQVHLHRKGRLRPEPTFRALASSHLLADAEGAGRSLGAR